MVHTGNTFSVYVLTNTVNGKRYVGCTRVPVMSRWGNGLCYKHNKALSNDIETHGWNSFTREVIATNLDYDTASDLEIEYINNYQATDPAHGYNKYVTRGRGLYGYVSKPHEGWNKGLKHTEETKKQMSLSHRGKKQTPEWVEKRMASMRGRIISESERAKRLPILKENSEKRKRPCYTINVITGLISEYECLKDASLATGCSAVSHAIKIQKPRNGHLFNYL